MREFTSQAAEPEENPLEGVSFTLDKVEFTCQGRLSVLEVSELAAAAVEGADTESPEGAALIAGFLRSAFGPAEYSRFRRHCRTHQTSDETLLHIVMGLQEEVMGKVETMTGRPTQSPSRSSRGQPAPEERMSRIISLQGGDVTVVPMPDPADRPAPRPVPQDRKAKKPRTRRAEPQETRAG